MSSDERNATWHPASMPHTVQKPAPIVPEAPVASKLPTTSEPAALTSNLGTLQIPDETSLANGHGGHRREDSGIDAWFPEYDAGSPWSDQHPTEASSSVDHAVASGISPAPDVAPKQDTKAAKDQAPAPAADDALPTQLPKPQTPETAAETLPEPSETTPIASPADSTANKHYSTISFTRTVPNDVNWDAEDDEPEWTISRSDTDPFQFMSPSDRTNSFPVVPPLAETEAEPPSHPEPPLASTQAMDFIEEVDKVQDHEPAATAAAPDMNETQADAAIDAWGLGEGDDNEDNSFFASAGADEDSNENQPASWEAPDTRFEEGIPLMSNEANTETLATQQNQPETKDPFAETDGDEDDDFFNNASAAANAETSASSPPAFERKSTMQVLQSMNVGNLSREEPLLEDAMVESPIKEEAEPVAESAEKAANGSVDLAAKWAAAFDEEDELLLEDALPETGEAAESIDSKATKELDPAAFFGDDDEGFLEDAPEEPSTALAAPQQQSIASAPTNRYLPQATPAQQPEPQHANPYLPTTPFAAAQPVVPSPYSAPGPAPSQFPINYGYDAAAKPPVQEPPRPTLRKAQSFADKSKGGYSSPYDLPMDVVKMPRKRQSMQQLSRANDATSTPQAPPPRSSSMQYPVKDAPPVAGSAMPPPPAPVAAVNNPPPLTKHDSFFEDLPVLPKARPASRHSQRSPVQQTSYGLPPQTPNSLPPPPHGQAPPQILPQASPYTPAPAQVPTTSVPPPSAHYVPPAATAPATAPPPQVPQTQTAASSAIGGLVAPPRVNPYAIQSGPSALGAPSLPPPAAGSMRYSSSPNQLATPNGVPQPSRYSPAPPNRVPSAGYAPAGTPPVLPHQPRTSSPLAHFEMSYDKPRASSVAYTANHGEAHVAERRSSSSVLEPRVNRVPSLPPTREEDEDQSLPQLRPMSSGNGAHYAPAPPSQTSQASTSQYSPLKQRQTPPPPANAYNSQSTLSPPKRILSYAPQQDVQSSPPRRSQTQSPGALYGNRAAPRTVDPIPRPSSVHEAAPPVPQPTRPRAPSQTFNLVPPTDGTETDPLQRWKGAPIFFWGAGGAFVSSFPHDVPRYGISQTLPMIHRAPGEVQIKNIKELQPLDERLSKFPGPLKGKSKKKEVLAWLTTGIEGLERSLPNSAFSLQISLDDKRLEERVILWKILRLFIEHDGVLEGNPAVEKAVREVLVPNVADALNANTDGLLSPNLADSSAGYVGFGAASQSAQSDAVDSAVVEQIRKNLLLGEKEKAVWDAVDKRLWGHAFLISGAASRDLFKKVAQEFVRKEVNTPGLNNESLAALYEVLSGNYEECVDELVPVHARAGLQLMTTQPSVAQPRGDDGLAGLDKWRETLCLILGNRSADDVQAINSMGNLLSGYGRAEAAHVCYLFSRNVTVFGGLDDPAVNFVLLGADHKGQVESFAKETDAVLLSEVYEYGLSLTSTSNLSSANSPHLAAYKLQHAMMLAEYGQRDKALQYCEAIVSAMTAQTRRSPYYHQVLEAAVEDLMKRLKSAPKEESNSWIPKPSMNKVSDTMWNRFNKFVAGDENEGARAGPDGEGGAESGPFARIAGGTPTISRPPSSSGLGGATGMEMFGGLNAGTVPSPTYGVMHGSATAPPPPAASSAPASATRAASRYAPGAAVAATVPTTPAPHPYEPATSASYTPLGTAAPTVTTPGANPYEPISTTRTSSPYAAPPSRRVSADTSAGEPAPYQPRQSSELSPGYSPYALAPTANIGAELASHAPSLSRKSSYTPLSQAEPTPPAAESSTYNPYAPPSDAAAAPATSSPYAPAVYEPQTAASEESRVEKTEEPDYGYQPPSYGYEPPVMNTSFSDEPPAPVSASAEEEGKSANQPNGNANGHGGYEPPSFQPYSYEPPSYEPATADPEGGAGFDNEDDAAPKPKARSFMDDDDDIPALKKPTDKSREEKDRENAEMFRKIAEEEAKRAAAEKEAKAKKGWGLTSWWSKKDAGADGGGGGGGGAGGSEAPKAVRANLGEKSSFYFDPELKRWVNKNANPGDQTAKATPAPPPPRSNPQSARSTPPPSMGGGPPMAATAPPMGTGGPPGPAGGLPPFAPAMVRSSSGASASSGPPSRPTTSMSDANSIDDLLGAAPGPRKAGAKKGRKGGRYIDVMAK